MKAKDISLLVLFVTAISGCVPYHYKKIGPNEYEYTVEIPNAPEDPYMEFFGVDPANADFCKGKGKDLTNFDISGYPQARHEQNGSLFITNRFNCVRDPNAPR